MMPEPFAATELRRIEASQLIGTEFEEANVHLLTEWDVETIKPGHRFVAYVLVSVEISARSQQQVASAHSHRVAVYHRPDPFPFDNEAKGILTVPVFGRCLMRAEILNCCPQGWADIGMWSKPRIA